VPSEPLLPIDVALGVDGAFYVADFASHAVVVFDEGGAERERWRQAFGSLLCDKVYVPVALDADATGAVAILWHAFDVQDGAPREGRTAGYVELRSPDGAITSVFRVPYEYTDMALLGDQVYLGQGLLVDIYTRTGLLQADLRVTSMPTTRANAGSFAVLAQDRVARISADGSVRINRARPSATFPVDIGGLEPLSVDAVGAVLHIVAVDPRTAIVHQLQASDDGRVLGSVPLDVPSDALTADTWPLSMAAGADGLLVVGADQDGLRVVRLDAAGRATADLPAGSPRGMSLNRPTLGGWAACRDANMSLGTATQDGVALYDHELKRVMAFDAQLRPLGSRSVITAVASFDASGPTGSDILMATTDDRLVRAPWDLAGAAIWDVPGVCEGGPGRVAWAGQHGAVACRIQKRIRRLDASSGRAGAEVVASSAGGLWPFDLALYPDGELVATDVVEKRLQRFAPDGTPLGEVGAGYAVGPRFVAVADQPQLGRLVVTSMWDDHLELRHLATGNLLVRWPAQSKGVMMRVADVAMDGQLRVYVLDGRNRMLHRFDPQAEAPPSTGATPTPSRTSCLVMGDKVAGPPQIVLGETATITLTLRADCPLAHAQGRLDIVLVVDNSGSMAPVVDLQRRAVKD